MVISFFRFLIRSQLGQGHFAGSIHRMLCFVEVFPDYVSQYSGSFLKSQWGLLKVD